MFGKYKVSDFIFGKIAEILNLQGLIRIPWQKEDPRGFNKIRSNQRVISLF